MFAPKNAFRLHYDNLNFDAFYPEQWAMESVAILVENLVATSLVHRDFEFMFARHGDVVNTRKPAEFRAKRKAVGDDITVQNADVENIPVKLDQHIHTSFLIRDGEETWSFEDLVQTYLQPATISLARMADQVVLAQAAQFLMNQSGSIGGLSSSNAVEYITNTGLVLDRNKAHLNGRQQIWTPDAQALIIQNPTFHQADRVGDDGTALRTASIGEKLNFRHWMAQNMSQVRQVYAPDTAAVNLTAGYGRGATVITVDASTTDSVAGKWLSINGKVYHCTSETVASGAGDITIEYGLAEPVANNDAVKIYTSQNVDFAAGYAANYAKAIAVDNGSGAAPTELQVGQLVTFGVQTVKYTIIDVDTTTSATETLILLDRPLEVALTDNLAVNYGPQGGGLNLAFHRNAITLAIRPLAPPRAGSGAISGVAQMGGATMRVVIAYDPYKQGHVVTLDFLLGVKVLDTDLGAVTLS